MTDFTREIKALEKQASVVPQMKPVSGNAVADVANLASTGLQLFGKMQAQDQLEQMRQQQAQQKSDISNATVGYMQLRQELKDQGVNTPVFRTKTREYLDRFDAETQLAIIKLSKETSGETDSDVVKAARQVEEDRLSLQMEGQTAAAVLGFSANVYNMSDQELNDLKLQANSKVAQMQAETSRLQLERDRQTTAEGRRQSEEALASHVIYGSFSPILNLNLDQVIQQFGGVSVGASPDIVRELEVMSQSLDSQVDAFIMNTPDLGYVSPAKVEQIKTDLKERVDNVISLFQNEETVKAMENTERGVVLQTIQQGLMSEEPMQRESAVQIMLSKATGSQLQPEMMLRVSQNLTSVLSGDMRGLQESGSASEFFSSLPSILAVASGEYTEQAQSNTVQVIENSLDGTKETVRESIQAGAVEGITALVAEEGVSVIPPMKADEISDILENASAKRIASTIQRMMFENTGQPTQQFQVMEEDIIRGYELDLDTFQFVKRDRMVKTLPVVGRLNSLMKNSMRSMLELGRSGEYIDNWKNDILLGIGISPIQE